MNTEDKLKYMASITKPILDMLDNRMNNKLEALKAYDLPIPDNDSAIKQIREIEAVKLRHEVDVLKDIKIVINAMFPNL